MNRNFVGLFVLGMFSLLFFSGCASTKILAVWRDKTYQAQPHKIMVIAILKKAAAKRFFEDEFVRQIKGTGTYAFASYTVMADAKQGDDTTIAAAMSQQGADAVLITRQTSREAVYTYSPACQYYPSSYYGTWRNYYLYGCQDLHSPGYVSETEYSVMESNLYDAGKSNLVWTASSKTEVSGSDQKYFASYVSIILKNMAKAKLLPAIK